MNKLFKFLAVSMFALFVAMPAYAATITLSPTIISVVKGQSISIAIQADPAGSKLYTVKSSVSFPATLLEMTSFTQSTGWVPLSMPGYDSVDNTSGTVVKTAGYLGGFSNATSFGTLVFRAKESGTATISVANSSFAYDAQSKNTISGTQGVSVVTVTASSVAVTPSPVITKKVVAVVAKKEEKKEVSELSKQVDGSASEQNQDINLAAVAEAVPATEKGNTLPLTAGTIVILGIIGAIAYVFYRKGRVQ
ncbi:MAG: cohesin domain-containing protein [Minisyncoccia bacterium]